MGERPGVGIQWQNTEVCFDLWCDCGADLHYDGLTSGHVQCSMCESVWVLSLTMRARSAGDFLQKPTLLAEEDDA